MKSNLPADPETCPRCYVGRIEQRRVTFSTIVGGRLLNVPDFPAWVCDVCHAFMYDPQAVLRLNAVLASRQASPEAAVSRKKKAATGKLETARKKTQKRTILPGN